MLFANERGVSSRKFLHHRSRFFELVAADVVEQPPSRRQKRCGGLQQLQLLSLQQRQIARRRYLIPGRRLITPRPDRHQLNALPQRQLHAVYSPPVARNQPDRGEPETPRRTLNHAGCGCRSTALTRPGPPSTRPGALFTARALHRSRISSPGCGSRLAPPGRSCHPAP